MSVRENIELFGLSSADQPAEVLNAKLGASKHPRQDNAYILENCPFHAPRQLEDHISIPSFNSLPIPDSLMDASVVHPELFSTDIAVRWTQEQDLMLGATLGELRRGLQSHSCRVRCLPLMCAGFSLGLNAARG
jgi:hypothetical protein